MSNHTRLFSFLLSMLFLFIYVTPLHAELKEHEKKLIEEEVKVKQAKKRGTIRIYPDIITVLRYDPGSQRVDYVMLRVDLVTGDNDAAKIIDDNQPMIIDSLILLLNKHSKQSLTNDKNHTSISKRIRNTVNKTLHAEAQKDLVKDIIIQKLIIE